MLCKKQKQKQNQKQTPYLHLPALNEIPDNISNRLSFLILEEKMKDESLHSQLTASH